MNTRDPLGLCEETGYIRIQPFGVQGTAGAGAFVHGEANIGFEIPLDRWKWWDIRMYIHTQGAVLFGPGAVVQVGPQIGAGLSETELKTGVNTSHSFHGEGGLGYEVFGGGSYDVNINPKKPGWNKVDGSGGALGVRGGVGAGAYKAWGGAVNTTLSAPTASETFIRYGEFMLYCGVAG